MPRTVVPARRELCETVSRMPLFRGVSRRHLAQAARSAYVVQLARGEALVQRSGLLPGLSLLVSGSLKLCLDAQNRESRIFGLVQPGESFAEAAALRMAPCPYEVVATAPAAVVVIPWPQVEPLCRRDPVLACNLIELLAERALAATAELAAGALQRAPARLATYLAELAETDESSGACRARLPVSKTLVAARLGITKATLSRLLAQLAKRGVISVAQRDITILDRAGLASAGASPDPARGA
jgi:CRP-like cAMP-binding protein